MDKYEFNFKVDQLKKMVKQGEFETAMRIADSINWRRVHNNSLLSVVSEVYEKNGEYDEAKAILELAFERSSKSQRILYNLTVLSLKTKNLEDAEEYYKEFYKEFPDDPRNFVLRYLILREKGAHVDQMILTLEKYVELELDEEWMYELAELYHEAGRSKECIKACDNIIMLFGLGQYVDKAVVLKTQKEGVPLTQSQLDLVQNRDKYDIESPMVQESIGQESVSENQRQNGLEAQNEYIPEVIERNEEQYQNEAQFDYQSQIEEPESIPEEEEVYEQRYIPREEYTNEVYGNYEETGQQNTFVEETEQLPLPNEEELNAVMNETSQEYDEATDEEQELLSEEVASTEKAVLQENTDEPEIDMSLIDAGIDYSETEIDGAHVNEAQTIAQIDNIVEEEQIGRDIKAMGEDVQEVEDSEHDKTKILSNIKAALEARETSTVIYADATAGSETEKIHIVEGDLMIEDLDYEEPEEEPEVFYKSAFVVVESLDDALSAAAEKLKEIYRITGEVKQIAKIKASKLNIKGVFASADRIGEKDLIIEGASDLKEQTIQELLEFAETSDKSLVFVDTLEGIDFLRENYPELCEICGGASINIEDDDFEDVSDIVTKDRECAIHRQEVSVREDAHEEEGIHRQTVDEERGDGEEVLTELSNSRVSARERKIFRGENTPDHLEGGADTETEQEEEALEETDASMLEEMDIEAFVEYADHYATKIDCIIPGNGINALFERAEIMEEDGITLNKLNAEALIEEVADRAEKPGLLRRIASIFSKRYDKNGLLILKEEHFIS